MSSAADLAKRPWVASLCATGIVLALGGCGSDDLTFSTGGGGSGAGGDGSGGMAQGGEGGSGQGGSGGRGEGGGGGVGGSGGSGGSSSFAITSPAFMRGGAIPRDQSCYGADVSPSLSWTAGPAGTQSYAIVLRDLTNTLGHSAIYDIPANLMGLPEDVDKAFLPPDVPGAKQPTGFFAPGYAGPCPGEAHAYEFRIYALDVAELGLDPMSASVDQVAASADQASLGQAALSGVFTP